MFRVVLILALLTTAWAGTALAIQVYTGPTELTGTVAQVFSGNSFALYNGTSTSVVVLEGVKTPKRGEENFLEAANYLYKMLFGKKVKVAITRKARFLSYGIVTELDDNINVNAQVLNQSFATEATEVALGGAEESMLLRGNVFHSATTGFSITKADGWVFLSAEDVRASRQNLRLEDRELELAIKQRQDTPLVSIARYPEPYAGLNPSVTVSARSVGGLLGQDPVSLMESTVPALEKAFADFTMVKEASPAMVDGKKAAYMKATYTISDAAGNSYQVISRIYLVPRGTVMFIIDCSALAADEAKVSRAFDQMMASVKIEQ